jgi:hypothetical protein
MLELHLTTTEVDYILNFEPAEWGGYRALAESLVGFMHQVKDIVESGLDRDWSD